MFGLSLAKILIYGAIILAIMGVGAGAAYKPAYNRGEAEGVKITTITFNAALKQQKDDAKALYDMANKRNLDLNKENDGLILTQRDLNNEITNRNTVIRNVNAKLGGLRDPGATTGRGSCSPSTGQTKSTSTGVSENIPTQTAGLLSEQATGFLRSLTFEADGDAQIARECKIYSDTVQAR